jgi:RND family efflux transporter MFP subunit
MTQPASPALQSLRIDRTASPTNAPRRLGKWLMLAALILGGVVFALRPGKTEVQVTSVLTAYPSQQYAQLTASGYVVAQRRAAVASKATGRLLWLGVREGSQVKQGDVLAKLDASDVHAAIGQAQAAVRQAEAGVAQATVELVNADSEYKRAQGLKTQGFLSDQAVESALARVQTAQAAINSAKSGVALANAQLKVQRVNLDYTEIRAPFDGVVLIKNANVGDIITPFSSAAGSQGAVVTMADMSTLEVEADVSESNLAKAEVGAPVEITLDALPGVRFRGQIAGRVPTVDRAKATVMTKIRFEKLDSRVLPEMSAKVTILSQAVSDADQTALLAVNPKAVVERDGKKQMLRINGELLELVTVNLGRNLGEVVEVKGELKSGDRVVLSPSDKLVQGSHVAVATK